jgi:hypothetical protein
MATKIVVLCTKTNIQSLFYSGILFLNKYLSKAAEHGDIQTINNHKGAEHRQYL